MKILAFATTKVRGGREFKAEMYKAAECWRELGHDVDTIEITQKKPADIWWMFLEKMIDYKTVDCMAFFAHGTVKWIHGVGLNCNTVGRLATQLYFKNTKLVILYSCSCGRSKGEYPWQLSIKQTEIDKTTPADGVAMMLGAELAKARVNADIICHGTYGHTTRNPYVYRVTSKVDYKITRMPIIQRIKDKKHFPAAVKWWKAWCKQLKTDLRFRFPFMKDLEIINEIRGSHDSRNETK